MLWMMFMRILMITAQPEKGKKNIFDDMIADIIKNKKFQAIIKDTTLPASDPLRFRKKLFDSYKNDNN